MWGHHDGGKDALAHRGTLPLNRFRSNTDRPRPLYTMFLRYRPFVAALIVLGIAVPATAQDYVVKKPRRQFVTVSLDWLHAQPLHFASHPLEDLVGREVAAARGEEYDYHTRDEQIRIDVVEFRERNRAASIALYPFGLSSGTTLGIRGSVEEVPTIRITFDGPEAPANYALTGARAYDVGAGLYVADRSSGWGLGSQAFVLGGIGRLETDQGEGTRIFAEGGGGLSVGPFGVQLAVKFAWNKLDEPVEHRFLTIPVTLRGTVSF